MDFGAISDLKKTHGIVRTQHGIVTTRRRQVGRRLAREAAQVVHHPLEVLAVCEALVEQRSRRLAICGAAVASLRDRADKGPFYN